MYVKTSNLNNALAKNDIEQRLNPDYIKFIVNDSNKQYINEKIIIDDYQSCPTNKDMEIIIKYLNSLSIEKLKEELRKNFMSHEFMQAASCVICSLNQVNSNLFPEFIRTRETIINEKKIGAIELTESLNGDAMIIGIKDNFNITNTVYVIKMIKSINRNTDFTVEEMEADIYHEAHVGFELNKFRDKIPNIVYTFGTGKSNQCYINSKNEIKLFSVSDYNTKPNIYLEYISHSIKDIIKLSSFKQIVSYLAQLFHTIDVLTFYTKYTHNDLHYGNVLFRPYNENKYIDYSTDIDENYVEIDGGIPVIIDLASCFIFNKENYGKLYVGKRANIIANIFTLESIYRDESFPLGDAFRILTEMLYETVSMPFHGELLELFKFFSDDSFIGFGRLAGIESNLGYKPFKEFLDFFDKFAIKHGVMKKKLNKGDELLSLNIKKYVESITDITINENKSNNFYMLLNNRDIDEFINNDKFNQEMEKEYKLFNQIKDIKLIMDSDNIINYLESFYIINRKIIIFSEIIHLFDSFFNQKQELKLYIKKLKKLYNIQSYNIDDIILYIVKNRNFDNDLNYKSILLIANNFT